MIAEVGQADRAAHRVARVGRGVHELQVQRRFVDRVLDLAG